MMEWVYLDNNATTQPDRRVVEVVREVLEELWANPSSVHRFGQMVRRRVELARVAVAELIHGRDRELVFTSGGTESNNLALRGLLEHRWLTRHGQPVGRVLITTPTEHAAIREPVQYLEGLGVRVVQLAVDQGGTVDPGALEEALQRHATPDAATLVSIQWANNETGVIQPIEAISRVVRQHRGTQGEDEHSPNGSGGGWAWLHVDATQAVGKLPVDVGRVPVDLMSMAAHKFHGPKGVGAIYIRSGVRLRPLLLGGPQERQRRGGTENTPGIVGMGVAARCAQAFLSEEDQGCAVAALRDRLESAITQSVPGAVVHGVGRPRLWNTSNIGFPRLASEAILIGLSERGVCASAGAACSSGSVDRSAVLLAMGVPEEVAMGSVRFSLSRLSTEREIDRGVRIVLDVVKRLSKEWSWAV